MASAARDLRYNSRSAVYGDLAYDLDRELRERELGHAGEMPRARETAVPAAQPKVRSVFQKAHALIGKIEKYNGSTQDSGLSGHLHVDNVGNTDKQKN